MRCGGCQEDDTGGSPSVPNYQDLPDVTLQGQRECTGVAYCESMLALAFHLVVAQMPNINVAKEEPVWAARAAQEAEVRAFWLLYQLVAGKGRQAFRDYYGVPRVIRTSTSGLESQLADRRGAIDDIHRLTFILARFEPDIWVHMNSLGFQLPSATWLASHVQKPRSKAYSLWFIWFTWWFQGLL